MGFLRKGKCYRAPCRWYPDGPIGTIEYYYAKPNAQYYSGEHIFFPLGFFGSDGQGGDVGELTGPGIKREYWSGELAEAGAGFHATGTADDFMGETAYPGPVDGDCVCGPPPQILRDRDLALNDRLKDVEIIPAIPPVYDCPSFPEGAAESWTVTVAGMVGNPGFEYVNAYNGVYTLSHHAGCQWRLDGPHGLVWLNNEFGTWRLYFYDGSVFSGPVTGPFSAATLSPQDYWVHHYAAFPATLTLTPG